MSESAQDVIRYYQARGVEDPRPIKNLQKQIIALQSKREKTLNDLVATYIKRNILNSEAKKRGLNQEQLLRTGNMMVFLDRSGIDSLAYEKNIETYKELSMICSEKQYSNPVFFVELLENNYKTNGIRNEDLETAVELGQKVKNEYEKQGYKIKNIPPGSLKSRIKNILEEIGVKNLESKLEKLPEVEE